MNMRKSIGALLLCLMIVALAGCGSGGGSATSAGNSLPSGSDTGSGGGATATATGVAKLSWNPPQSGAAIGFKVYYGTSPGTYSSSVNVGMTSSYTVNGLAPGTYYFVVTAVDSSGNESGYSNEASKTIS
jgi:hypothetical protein